MPKHVRKGDMVMVRAGNQRGTVAEILAVLPDEDRVIVKGVNIRISTRFVDWRLSR